MELIFQPELQVVSCSLMSFNSFRLRTP